MKNALTSVFLAATMVLSLGCMSHRDRYERRVAAILADVDSPGKNLAEGIKYLAAQEVSASRQVQ